MIQEKSLLDFQQSWMMLVDKSFADYHALRKDERVWLNVQSLIGQVDNGGLISHYYNSGADRNSDTIEDLRYLNCNEIAELLIKINELFPGGYPPKDIHKRNEIISNWRDGEHDHFLNLLDHKFYEKERDLEQKLIEHIINAGLNK